MNLQESSVFPRTFDFTHDRYELFSSGAISASNSVKLSTGGRTRFCDNSASSGGEYLEPCINTSIYIAHICVRVGISCAGYQEGVPVQFSTV